MKVTIKSSSGDPDNFVCRHQDFNLTSLLDCHLNMTEQPHSQPSALSCPTSAAVIEEFLHFWMANTQAWFEQAEAQFSFGAVVVEDARYWHMLSSFDTATSVRF